MIALIAPYDKSGVADFARVLVEMGFDIVSTSGTLKHLSQAGVEARSVSELTGFPEILDGRVKTLHPAVHGGLLARRDKPEHMSEIGRQGIAPIDLVCVNLYPFRETVAKPGVTMEEALENIDIGGPAMLRAAAKNYPSVLVLVDPGDYGEALQHLRSESVPLDYRKRLAEKAFQHVASYDTAIAQYLRSQEQGESSQRQFPQQLTIALEKMADLRYGENPHQSGALYREDQPRAAALESAGLHASGIIDVERLHGLELSYLNVFDADAAWRAATEFHDPTVVIVKHATPCGIASHEDIAVAYQRAFDCDPVSPFGGIIAANRAVTWGMTEAMKGMRYDVIVAPGYEERALERLKKRRDLRILSTQHSALSILEYRSVGGGILVQESDSRLASELELRVMTKRAPTAIELDDLRFAWTCVKHVKSNAIVIARESATVGIGAGQPNRLWPTQQAIERAGERAKGAVAASDAFFPFARDDAVEIACRAGVTAIIQPGGGVRDEEAVEVCNEYGVAMVFTGTRAFRH
jgi:phosphoribosylaminoimidazolecarboxamide formyltransferase/IMP cyclohydrolase